MDRTTLPPVFRTEDRSTAPVQRFRQIADIFEALFQSVQGGETHARTTLELTPDSPMLPFLEVGYALRACLERPERHDYLLQRLRPHLSVMIGTLPASIMPLGMLPKLAPLPGFRPLEALGDDEVRAWLIQEGGLIYGEMQRFELENYFDAIKHLVPPGGVMVDLGSGLGKVVMSAALSLPFARCIGVELLNYRHRLAQERLVRLLTLARQGFLLLQTHAPDTLSWTSVMIYQRVGPPMAEPACEVRYLHQPDADAWETRAREELSAIGA